MQVVAFVPGGVGEQILFFPTLDDLKQYYPDAQIDVVVEPRSKDAYRISKSVHRVIPFDFKDRNSLADWGNLVGAVRDHEYDVAIAVGQFWSVGLLLWLTGIRTRIGYRGEGSNLTSPVPLKTDQYAASMYHDLLQGLGINTPCPEIAINVPKSDIDWAESEQKRLGIKESGYVLIHGGSSPALGNNIDQYPVENWQQIVQDCQQRQPELPVVVIQLEDEQLVGQLLQSCPNIKVTSPTDIGKLAALIAGASLVLCTDSVPMYLAVAVQTYTIALFGSTDPRKLLPASDRFIGIKSPTGKMADISPQTVIQRMWNG